MLTARPWQHAAPGYTHSVDSARTSQQTNQSQKNPRGAEPCKAKLEYLVSLYGCRHRDGRLSAALLLRRGESTKVTLAQTAGT